MNEPNGAIDRSTALILADKAQSVDLYKVMCAAIAECARVDQAQEIRNRAKALEEYTRQSKNFEAEAQLSGIRLRAERRAGELLIEMAEKGERHKSGGDTTSSLNHQRSSLSDLGISENNSSVWQQLARIPAPEFEAAVAAPGVKSTYKMLAEHRVKHPIAAKAHSKHAPQATQCGRSQRAADHYRQRICEAVMKLADGKARVYREITDTTGYAAVEDFLGRVRMLPWVEVQRTEGDAYRVLVDEELRMICEDHEPRPQLNGLSVQAFIKRLSKEIYRKRKENNEKNKAIKWNPDNTLKTEQKRLLDWIELELSKLTEFMASSGPDYSMSATRTQNHPDADEEGQNVLQEEHSNRIVNARPC